MEMGMDGMEIEALLEKAWDLHDKISDAIHFLSKFLFLTSQRNFQNMNNVGCECNEDILEETRSLSGIRNALEVLEDHLHLLHIRQSQQCAETDAAFSEFEKSRLLLLKMLLEHRGRHWDFIQEAIAVAADKSEYENLHGTSPTYLYPSLAEVHGAIYSKEKDIFEDTIDLMENKSFGFLTHFLSLSIGFVKDSDKFHKIARVVAKTALAVASMLAIYGMQKAGQRNLKRYGFHAKVRAHISNNQCREQGKFINMEDEFGIHTIGERMGTPVHLRQKHLDVALGMG